MNLALPPISCKVPTPEDLAIAIVRAVGDKPEALWLEPSHGEGVFLRALAGLGVTQKRIVAIDLDPQPAISDNLAQSLRRVDFLKWAQTTEKRFDFIVGNPPYVSIKRLRPSLRQIASRVEDIDGNPIGTRANTWYAFVISAIRLLKNGGSFAFVLPSAAEFADYTLELRTALKDSFESLEIFRSKKSMFPGVQEGTVVAIARGYGQKTFRYRRREFSDKKSLIAALLKQPKGRGKLCPDAKIHSGTPLMSIAKIRLGGVTGDAGYFLMNEERRKNLGLPTQTMKPVVSKAKQLRSATIDQREWDTLRQSGERIWLFSPRENDKLHREVRDYLELDAEVGGCNKRAFKVAARQPWYTVPLPAEPHAFISGMAQAGPWLSFNEMNSLNATNTLYVVTFRDKYQEDWYKWGLAMLTSAGQTQIRQIGRRYADGLIKYEPGLLAKLVLPSMKHRLSYRELYHDAVEALLDGNLRISKKIADANLA